MHNNARDLRWNTRRHHLVPLATMAVCSSSASAQHEGTCAAVSFQMVPQRVEVCFLPRRNWTRSTRTGRCTPAIPPWRPMHRPSLTWSEASHPLGTGAAPDLVSPHGQSVLSCL